MKKYALGVHHLNIAYCSGDISSYHRQVRESVIPLLNLLTDHPGWCFSIELCGFSIEFIALNYPETLANLKGLINEGQVELISVTYAPQIWIAFPGTDLIRSIRYNRELLNKYGIKPSRIFFTQENFSGIGIGELKEWFDIAIVKDDYYFHFNEYPAPLSALPPYFSADNLKLLVGWGHILESLGANLNQKAIGAAQTDNYYDSYVEHSKLISDAYTRYEKNPLSGFVGKLGNLEWTWYHIGSSERFSKPLIFPGDHTTCRFDVSWYYLLESILLGYEERGFSFTGIMAFLDTAAETYPVAEPPGILMEGAWNMSTSSGGLIWMGINNNEHEDALGIRNLNWLSRSRLLAAGSLLNHFSVTGELNIKMTDMLNEAWRCQFLAESSDATGWYPEPSEIRDSIENSELVLNIVAELVGKIRSEYGGGSFIIDTKTDRLQKKWIPWTLVQIKRKRSIYVSMSFSGGSHVINYYQVDKEQQLVVIDFIPDNDHCGLTFKIRSFEISYSPTLMEDQCLGIDLRQAKPDEICLALPNGLLGIGKDTFVIKHNEYMNVACCVNKVNRSATYKIIGPHKKLTRWKLSVFKGAVEQAIELANSINVYPTVCLQ